MNRKWDILTIAGLIIAWIAILVGARLEGLHLGSLFKISALCIVLLGTLGATSTGYTLEQIKGLPRALKNCFTSGSMKPGDVFPIIIGYTKKARHGGLLILESELKKQDDPFLKKCLQLLIDGNSTDNIKNIIESELCIWEDNEKVYEKFFKAMGGFSPTLGIIGTVMGLIHVMGNIDSPDKIASGIATAFIATFYGVSFANLIFLPVAAKLQLRREEELLTKEMILEGIISIGSGDSSIMVKDKLSTYLSKEDKLFIFS